MAGSTIVKEGGKSWFFITADVAFGHSLEHDVAENVKENGGTVKGMVRHPLGNADFSSMLLQAQSSGAQVLGLATGGSDLINAIKGAHEFNLGRTMKIAAPMMFLTDIHALGLDLAQGLYYTDGWYWDYDDESREWANRYFQRRNSMPTMYQAGNASVANHYLNAVKEVGTDADKVMEQMKNTPINDFFTKNGKIRPDGRMVHDMFLMQIKSPVESKYPWDYVRVVGVAPGSDVFLSQEESRCVGWGKKTPN